MLDGLDEAQRAAVTAPVGPVRVRARAGTGKTRVVTRRIAWRASEGTLDIRRTLAITFTTRAARELRTRLGTLLGRDTGTAGTFHAIAYRMLRDHHAERGTTPPTIVEDQHALVADAVGDRQRSTITPIAREITWAAARGVTPAEYSDAARSAGRTPNVPVDRVAEVFDTYVHLKHRRGVVDFDDLITHCTELIETDPGFRSAHRWRHRHFFVDEYQDVNPMQQRLLDAWLGDRTDLFVVGDPNQAIYAFNGADATYLNDFCVRYPDAADHELTANHRSTSAIVRVADAVLGRPTDAKSGGDEPGCTVTTCADEESEAITIARAIRSEHAPGRTWRAQAVLVRTNAQVAPIAGMLRRAGIPVADPQFPRDDAVTIASFHSAKGLEWPVVHVAGLEEGFVPDVHARTREDLAEEQRLAYVAFTRATRRLHVTWAKQRRFGERKVDRSPSRWLDRVERTIATMAPPPPRRPSPIPRPDDGGARRPAVDATRERILAWRAATARAAGVPVAVVLADAVVDELVRRTPDDEVALVETPGLGRVKAMRYAAELLDALHPEVRPDDGSTEPADRRPFEKTGRNP